MARRRGLVYLLVGFVLGSSASAFGSHQFTDVPTGAIYHDAVDWLVNRAVTLGCVTGMYCPDGVVTRAQMALFMQRLGTALTPTHLTQQGGFAAPGAPIDLDVPPIFCQTTSDYVPAYNQRAVMHARVSVKPSAQLDYLVYPVWSANGGTVWNLASPPWSVEVRASDTTGHVANSNTGFVNLTPTLPYRFGLSLQRGSGSVSGGGGTGDIASYFCSLLVEIQNRSGAAVPFGSPTSLPSRRPAR
jgi:hypothetical protein